MPNAFLAIVVSVATWLTPMPQYAQGLLVMYGSQELVEANANYRGYDLSGYWQRCGVSVISPSDLGKALYLRRVNDDGSRSQWYGPCLGVDVAGLNNFAHIVYDNHEIAEVPFWLGELMGFENGGQGEVWVGVCKPNDDGAVAQDYAPAFEEYHGEARPLFWPYPVQDQASDCGTMEKMK